MALPPNGNPRPRHSAGVSDPVFTTGPPKEHARCSTVRSTTGSERNARTASQVTVRESVFGLLRAFNLTTVFGNPGSTELPMFRNFPADFRYVLGLQESVALGMADGYAQATGNAALVNLHSATGVGHAMGNLFTAYRNQTPLVITAGQQARSILPFEPFLYLARPANFPGPT